MRFWKKEPEPKQPSPLLSKTIEQAKYEGTLTDWLVFGIPGNQTDAQFIRAILSSLWFSMESYVSHLENPKSYYRDKLKNDCQTVIDWLDGKLTP